MTLNSVPDPLSGVKSREKAEMRRVFIVPGPAVDDVTGDVPVGRGQASGLGKGRLEGNNRRVKEEIALAPDVAWVTGLWILGLGPPAGSIWVVVTC